MIQCHLMITFRIREMFVKFENTQVCKLLIKLAYYLAAEDEFQQTKYTGIYLMSSGFIS